MLVTCEAISLIKGVTNDGGTTPLRTLAGFPVTRWSLVADAAGEAEVPLEALCRQYWQPVYAVARLSGNDVETAKDLTQGFFAKLLEKGWLADADRGKGRFRTFLVTALKRYMVNEWHREHAAKRGGFAATVPLDAELAERIGANDASRQLSPDELFDRRWALALLDAALRRLEAEYSEAEFARLKDCLTAGRGEIEYGKLAENLATTEGAARVAVHRLRKRYRALIREEVARTVSNETEVDHEMRALMDALL
jgi:RNA polymerase sigma-70 factor (ECF subfamily)